MELRDGATHSDLASTGPPLIGGGELHPHPQPRGGGVASTGPPLIGGGEARIAAGVGDDARAASIGPPLIGGGE